MNSHPQRCNSAFSKIIAAIIILTISVAALGTGYIWSRQPDNLVQPSPSTTLSPIATVPPTSSPIPQSTGTPTLNPSPTPSPTAKSTPTPTVQPTPSQTQLPSSMPSSSQTPVPKPTPTPVPSSTPTPENHTEPGTPDVYVLDDTASIMQERICAETLQGIVNRECDTGQIYLVGQGTDWHWINYYRDRFNMTYEIVPDFKTLLNLTKAMVKGYVVYDIDTPGSQFIAATICGLNNSIAISSYMIPLMEELGIPQDMDLRGILRGRYLTQVYDWGYNNLWSKCSRDVIGNMIHGTDWIKLDLTSYFQNSSSVYIKFEDSDTPDGNGAQLAAAVLDVSGNGSTWILPRQSATEAPYLYEQKGSWLNAESHRVAGWDQYWTYKIQLNPGVSANLTLELYGQYKVSIATDPAGEWTNVAYYRFKCDDPFAGDFYTQVIDYLVSKKAFIMSLSSSDQPDYGVKQKFLSEMNSVGLVVGWFGPYDTEAAHVGHVSANGLTTICGFPQSPNFSLHSKIQPTITFDQNFPDPQNVKLENKVYVTFVFSDGDALWSNNNLHYRNWLTNERGQIPLGWEMSLALLDLAPGMAQYYYETCTSNDEIVASVSGYGYFLPNLTPTQDVRLNLEKANLYMKTLDIKELYIMVDGKSSNATRQLYGSIMNNSDMFFEGFAAAPGTMPQITLAQDTPWTWTSYPVRTLDFSDKSAQQLADDLAAVANASGNVPCFIAVHVMPFDYMVSKLVEISHLLNSTHFEVVTPNKFAILAQQALVQQNQTATAGTTKIIQYGLPLSLMTLQVVSCLNISGEFNILQILPRRLKRDASS